MRGIVLVQEADRAEMRHGAVSGPHDLAALPACEERGSGSGGRAMRAHTRILVQK
jgi:hypothetical protein